MQNVTVMLTRGMKRSLIYVALSRVTSLEGLHIIGEFNPPSPPKNDDPVVLEMKRLETTAMLVPKFQQLRMVPENEIQVLSFNVQSLKAHIDSVKSDFVFKNSTVLLLQETWMRNTDMVNIPEMVEVTRNEVSNNKYRGRGTVIYAKQDKLFGTQKQYCFEDGNEHIEITSCIIEDILMVNVYKNPATKNEFFKNALTSINSDLQHNNILICGDFNDDLKKCNTLVNIFRDLINASLLSSVIPTTLEGTTIDAVFGRLNDFSFETMVYESVCSHHKPLIVRLKSKDLNTNS